MVRFIYAGYEDVLSGATSDIYFYRTLKVLEGDGLRDVRVHAEVTPSSLPQGYRWAVFAGLREVLKLLEGKPLDVYAIPEGTVFRERDHHGTRLPVVSIEGPYGEFAVYETPLLGFLSTASGIATKASRVKKAAGDALVLSFGARRTHPAVAPFTSFYAYVGGCDGVSCVKGAEFLGVKPMGTMPHSLMIIYRAVKGDHTLAWKAFDKHVEEDVPRIVLVDTFWDEAEEALRAAESLGDRLWGVRLDTPGSRRGNMADIIREVRWKLRAMGFDRVRIVVSGGIDERVIPELRRAGADAFGVGTAIANAPIVDYAMDIVAVEVEGEWRPISKRGKLAGRKRVFRCWRCMEDVVALLGEGRPRCPRCGAETEELTVKVMEGGKIIYKLKDPGELREYVLDQVRRLEL